MVAPSAEAPKPPRFVVDQSNPLVSAKERPELDDAIFNLAKLPPIAIAQNLCQLTANPLAQDVGVLGLGMDVLDRALKKDESHGITPEFLREFETFGELMPGVIRKACSADRLEFDNNLMYLDKFAKRASTKKTSIGILGTIMGSLDSDDIERYISTYHSKLPLDVYAGSVAQLARNPRLATHPELVEYALYGLEKKFDVAKPELASTYDVRSALSSFFSGFGYALTRHQYEDEQIRKHISKPYFEIVRKNPKAVKASLGYYQGMVEMTSAPTQHELFANEVLGPILRPPIEPIASRYILLTQVVRSSDVGQLQNSIGDIFDGFRVPKGGEVKVDPKLAEDFFQAWDEKIDMHGIINEEALIEGVTSFINRPANADLRMTALPLVKKLARQVRSKNEWDKCVHYDTLKYFNLQSAVEVITDALENVEQSHDLIKRGHHASSVCYYLGHLVEGMGQDIKLQEGESNALKHFFKRYLDIATDPKSRPETVDQIRDYNQSRTLGLGYLHKNPSLQSLIVEVLKEFGDKNRDPQVLIAMIPHLDRFPPQFVAQMVARIEPTKYDLNNGLASQVIRASVEALEEAIFGSELYLTIGQPATQELFEGFFSGIRGLVEIAIKDKKTAGIIIPPLSRLMGKDIVMRNNATNASGEAPRKFFGPQTQEIFKTAFSTTDKEAFTYLLTALANNEENFIYNNEAGDQMKVIDMVISNQLSNEKGNALALLKLITSFENNFLNNLHQEIKRGDIDLPTCKAHIEGLRTFVDRNQHLKKAVPVVDGISTKLNELEKHMSSSVAS